MARLKAAGAILVAKTNCPPGGGGGDTENVVYGRTLNPYNLACTPGGSSGGEAALVAAGGSPLGLGSDRGEHPAAGTLLWGGGDQADGRACAEHGRGPIIRVG